VNDDVYSPDETEQWLRDRSRSHEGPRVSVRWSELHQGFLVLTNPISGEVCEILAKGLAKTDRWLFDRLPPKN